MVEVFHPPAQQVGKLSMVSAYRRMIEAVSVDNNSVRIQILIQRLDELDGRNPSRRRLLPNILKPQVLLQQRQLSQPKIVASAICLNRSQK